MISSKTMKVLVALAIAGQIALISFVVWCAYTLVTWVVSK